MGRRAAASHFHRASGLRHCKGGNQASLIDEWMGLPGDISAVARELPSGRYPSPLTLQFFLR